MSITVVSMCKLVNPERVPHERRKVRMRKVQSTCNFCAIDCNLDFYVEDGRIVRTVPTKGYPVNDGFS